MLGGMISSADFLKVINVSDLLEIDRRNLLMTKPCHDPLITIISHSLSIDMLFIIDSVDMIAIVIPSQEKSEVCYKSFNMQASQK